MSSHTCPVARCSTTVPDHLLMCGPHWRSVPLELQRAVYRAYRRGDGVGTEALADAQQAAIAAVNAAVIRGGRA